MIKILFILLLPVFLIGKCNNNDLKCRIKQTYNYYQRFINLNKALKNKIYDKKLLLKKYNHLIYDIESNCTNQIKFTDSLLPVIIRKPNVTISKTSKHLRLLKKTNINKWNPKIYRGEKSYTKNSKNTVKDNYTNLIWQKQDDRVKRNCKEAKKYCQNLIFDGYNDWRLPTIKELYYLGDVTKISPAIDTNYFNVQNKLYCSASIYKHNSYNWIIDFNSGTDSNQSNEAYTLCVRE